MVNDKYAMNKEAVIDLTKYLINLRKQSGRLPRTKLAFYMDMSHSCVEYLEKNTASIPQFETLLRLIGYWKLSDEQVAEIYKAFCNQGEKLKIVDKNIIVKSTKVKINRDELYNLSSFWYNSRKNLKLNIRKVTFETGISLSSISNAETGKLISNLSVMIPLCKFYGVTESQMLDFYHRAVPSLNDKEQSKILIKNNIR